MYKTSIVRGGWAVTGQDGGKRVCTSRGRFLPYQERDPPKANKEITSRFFSSGPPSGRIDAISTKFRQNGCHGQTRIEADESIQCLRPEPPNSGRARE